MKTIFTRRKKYNPGEFFQLSYEGTVRAAKLNKNGLLLWLYLCRFKDNTTWNLSPQAISNEMGVSIDVAKSMTKENGGYGELVNAGFIKDGVFYADGYNDE